MLALVIFVLAAQGLFRRFPAVKGFVLSVGIATDLRRAFFPTGEDARLAAFPDDVVLGLLRHFGSG